MRSQVSHGYYDCEETHDEKDQQQSIYLGKKPPKVSVNEKTEQCYSIAYQGCVPESRLVARIVKYD